MSLFRPIYTDKKTGRKMESAVWWYEFTFNGKRYRESTKTSRKTLAADYEKRRRLELERHLSTGVRPTDPKRMLRTVKDAMAAYQAGYDAPNHRAKSIAWVKERSPHVVRLLGNLALLHVDDEHVLGYMRARTDEGASNRTINMELLCLARATGRTWKELWPSVPKLEEATDVGRALSAEEEGRILGASMKNRSRYIHPFIRVALCTAMRGGEIRTLQIGRLDMVNRELRVGKAKTPAGEGRGIPMNKELYDTIRGHLTWLTKRLGNLEPDWYLFPLSNSLKPIDPTQPVTTLKSAWESVRTAAKVECRLHDLRHTALTKMAENGVPEETMKAIAGHMSRAMLERYSHIRMEAKRKAVAGLTLAKPIIEVPKVSPKVRSQGLVRIARKA